MEVITAEVEEDGTLVVDDLVAEVDAEGNIVAADELVEIDLPDGTVILDETFSVADEDGDLVVIDEETTVLTPGGRRQRGRLRTQSRPGAWGDGEPNADGNGATPAMPGPDPTAIAGGPMERGDGCSLGHAGPVTTTSGPS